MTDIESRAQRQVDLARRVAAEVVGSAFLLAAVVGSGIMGERLSGGNVGLALLANTIATGAALVALILTFGPISGAHFNPAVTVSDALLGGISWSDAATYIVAQVIGAIGGVILANVMFELPPIFLSTKVRTGPVQWLAEFVAAFGLLAVIWGCSRKYRSEIAPFAVAAYIT